MRKLNTAAIVLVMIGSLFALMIGCGGESPESLFGTVQFEEKQTNFAHAKELYEQIIREHSDSEKAKMAKKRKQSGK